MRKALSKDLQTIRKQTVPILRRYGVKRASVFGSFARGDNKKKSDVDLLVEVPPMGLLEFVGLKQDLEERLGRRVDLVSYRSVHPVLKRHILREQVAIYEKKL